ncbi:hypothetical protein [Pararobbsia silviterrae]|uniref:O-spanin n=1 Tax=Pararobbsia silviterrae TaxID=1792498 RepID=A0A494X1U4_9BURK|nr:hypothetical protein [Pararobbsia silviterrae]RKP44695.1 hypothetical protein D7S86_27075 [Pararobbsia silviterrae]
MKSLLCALLCSAALAACASGPAIAPAPVLDVKVQTVDVPTPVACVDKVPDKPALLSDQDLLAGSGAQVVDQLWRDHVQRRDYEAVLEPIVSKCAAIPVAASAPAAIP